MELVEQALDDVEASDVDQAGQVHISSGLHHRVRFLQEVEKEPAR